MPRGIEEILHLVGYRGPEIIGAVAGLSDRRRIDIDLHRGLALGKDIGLEIGGYLDDEQQFALVHLRIDLGRPDLHGGLKRRAHQALRRSAATVPSRPRRRCRPRGWSPR